MNETVKAAAAAVTAAALKETLEAIIVKFSAFI
jgi:hypothetical protein